MRYLFLAYHSYRSYELYYGTLISNVNEELMTITDCLNLCFEFDMLLLNNVNVYNKDYS